MSVLPPKMTFASNHHMAAGGADIHQTQQASSRVPSLRNLLSPGSIENTSLNLVFWWEMPVFASVSALRVEHEVDRDLTRLVVSETQMILNEHLQEPVPNV